MFCWPVGALVVVVGAQERVHALAAMPHVVVGRARRVVPLIVLARSRQHAIAAWMSPRDGGGISVRRSLERRAHQCDRAEHVGTHQRAPRGNRRAEIVPHHGGDRAAPECVHQPKLIAHRIQQTERAQIRLGVVIGMPAGGAAIAAQVRCDDMEPGIGQRRHDPAPGIRQFGKPVQQQHTGPSPAANPASRMCTRSPLTSGTKRERTPAGSTALSSGASSVIVSSPMLRRGRMPPRCVRGAP